MAARTGLAFPAHAGFYREVVSWEFAVEYMSLQAQGFPRRLHTPTSLRSSIPQRKKE